MNKSLSYASNLSTKKVVSAGLLTSISIILTRYFAIMIPLAGLPSLRIGFGSIPIIISGILFGPLIGALTGIVADLIGFSINPMGGIFFIGFTISSALYGILPGLIYKYIRSSKLKLNYNIINIISILLFSLSVLYIMFINKVLIFKNNILYLYNDKLPIFFIVFMLVILFCFISIPILMNIKYKNKIGIYSFDKILFSFTTTYLIVSLMLDTLWLSILYSKGYLVFLPGRVLSAIFIIPIHSIIIFTLSKSFSVINTEDNQ
ncbi:MAG: folate family ECF transporter S component [Clostridiaceae bacterium]